MFATLAEKLAQFRPVDKLSPTKQMRVMKIQKACEDLVTEIDSLVPFSPDQTVALRRLLEVKWICTHAITHAREVEVAQPQEAPKAPEAKPPQKSEQELETEALQAKAEKNNPAFAQSEKEKFKNKGAQ